jgi:nicotinic acid phosphoribosyltransferase
VDKDIVPSTHPEASQSVNPPTKQELFIRNLFLFDSAYEAAIAAGYSESTASGTIYHQLKSKKLQDKIRDYAKTHELLNIPKVLKLEDKALDYLKDITQELPKFSALLKQKKQIAGLLHQDVTPQVPTISIGEVQNLMLNVSSSATLPLINDDKDITT